MDCLPTVSSCLGSIPLKVGCIIIAFITAFCCLSFIYGWNMDYDCAMNIIMNTPNLAKFSGELNYVHYGVAACYVVCGILLLIGVAANVDVLIIVYCYVILAAAILTILKCSLTLTILIFNWKYCSAGIVTPAILQFIPPLMVAALFVANYVWVPFERGFFCGDESLMFPYREDTVTVPMLRVVGLGLPILAFLICEWALLRNEKDEQHCFGLRIPAWVHGCYCTAASFVFGVCFIELTTQITKNIIGRPRPHFFDLCQPSIDCNSSEWHHRYVQSDEYVCTGDRTDRFKDMRMSFLSGHSSWAAYTMIYLALYLEKRMIWRGTRALRHTMQFGAVMLSWYTALSRVSDYKHHWSDVLAGYFMGLLFAVLVWFWGTDLVKRKSDHSPLPQNDVNMTTHHITAESA